MRALFKEKLFKKHYDKLIVSRKEKSRKPSINSILSITILVAAKNTTAEDIRKSMFYFQRMGMICYVYVIKEKGEVVEKIKDVNTISQEDCLWYGVPSQEILIDWLSNKTDLLILSNPGNMLLMKYLCAASNSKLKTSVTYQGKDLKDQNIDFCVDVPQAELLPLIDQCQLIYTNLMKIGMKPPVIG